MPYIAENAADNCCVCSSLAAVSEVACLKELVSGPESPLCAWLSLTVPDLHAVCKLFLSLLCIILRFLSSVSSSHLARASFIPDFPLSFFSNIKRNFSVGFSFSVFSSCFVLLCTLSFFSLYLCYKRWETKTISMNYVLRECDILVSRVCV